MLKILRYPQSPVFVSTDNSRMIFPFGCVSFTMLKVAVGTIQEVIKWLQSVLALEAAVGAKVGISVDARVASSVGIVSVGARVESRDGMDSSVFVGTGVSVGISVGGTWVLVGSTACVNATCVKAEAWAVF